MTDPEKQQKPPGSSKRTIRLAAAAVVVLLCLCGVVAVVILGVRKAGDKGGGQSEGNGSQGVSEEKEKKAVLKGNGGLNTDLLAMSANGWVRDVDRLLRMGADPNYVEGTKTPLIVAASRNYTTVVTTLIEAGADVDLQTPWGNETALQVAASSGHTEILDLLLEAGADPNLPDKNGMTALHHASNVGDIDDVGALIMKGADIDLIGKGKTPLHYAAWGGKPDTIILLIKEGAKVDSESVPEGDAPLALAAMRNHGEAILALLDAGSDINHFNKERSTALHWAAHYGHLKAIRLLVEQGADKTLVNEASQNPRKALCTCTDRETDVLFCQFRPCKRPKEMIGILEP